MSPSERGIVFTNDLDGVHFKTRVSLRTISRLIRRVPLPQPGAKIGEHNPQGIKERALSRLSIFMHLRQGVNREALESLEDFRVAAHLEGRDLKFAVLSGRESHKHEVTERRLRDSGHMIYFSDLFLNQGARSIPWKEWVVRRLLGEGKTIVHIDDDIRAGLCIARLGEDYPDETRVLVYVLRNLSNHPVLLRRAQIEIPPNLVMVASFGEAAADFSRRLTEKRI